METVGQFEMRFKADQDDSEHEFQFYLDLQQGASPSVSHGDIPLNSQPAEVIPVDPYYYPGGEIDFDDLGELPFTIPAPQGAFTAPYELYRRGIVAWSSRIASSPHSRASVQLY